MTAEVMSQVDTIGVKTPNSAVATLQASEKPAVRMWLGTASASPAMAAPF